MGACIVTVCELKMNIAFVIDESATSTTEGFQEILKFVADVSQRLMPRDDHRTLSLIQLKSDGSSYIVTVSITRTCYFNIVML